MVLPTRPNTQPNQEFGNLLDQGKERLYNKLATGPTDVDQFSNFMNVLGAAQSGGAAVQKEQQRQTQNQFGQDEQLRAILATEDERSLQVAKQTLDQQIAERDEIASQFPILWPDELQQAQAMRKFLLGLMGIVELDPNITDDDQIPMQQKRELLASIVYSQPAAMVEEQQQRSRVVSGDTEEGQGLGIPPGENATITEEIDPSSGEYKVTDLKRFGTGIELTQTFGETAELLGLKASIRVTEEQLKLMQEPLTDFELVEPRLLQIAIGLESGKVNTGPFASILFPFRQALNELGFTTDENLPQAEQVRSAMAFLIPRMRVAGSGQTSNREMETFKQAAPNYFNSTEGNALLARSMLQANRYNEDRYDLALVYVRQDAARGLQGFGDYADEKLGPLFMEVKDDDDFAKVKKGDVYFHWHKQRWKVK